MGGAKLGIVNYGGGNIFSLTSALGRAGIAYELIDRLSEDDPYDRYIIPGVGHAGKCIAQLTATGMATQILDTEKPVLGICVGMQLLTELSEEGNSTLLGRIPLRTRKFDPSPGLKIPHMGWNNVEHDGSLLFDGIAADTHFYFVHSFFVDPSAQHTIARATHGNTFSAAIRSDNFFGVQFHPEKSGAAGERLLINFTKI